MTDDGNVNAWHEAVPRSIAAHQVFNAIDAGVWPDDDDEIIDILGRLIDEAGAWTALAAGAPATRRKRAASKLWTCANCGVFVVDPVPDPVDEHQQCFRCRECDAVRPAPHDDDVPPQSSASAA